MWLRTFPVKAGTVVSALRSFDPTRMGHAVSSHKGLIDGVNGSPLYVIVFVTVPLVTSDPVLSKTSDSLTGWSLTGGSGVRPSVVGRKIDEELQSVTVAEAVAVSKVKRAMSSIL